MKKIRAGITGVGIYAPTEAISNSELVASFNSYANRYNTTHAALIATGERMPLKESSAEFIEKASGIKQRRVLDKANILDINHMQPVIHPRVADHLSLQAEFGLQAAEVAIARAGISPQALDGVIVATTALSRAFPAIAIEIQAQLGITGFAFDMDVACSSSVFGLQQAVNSILAGQSQKLLVISPELCTPLVNFKDRDSHFIFGDACSAVVVENIEGAGGHQVMEIISLKTQTSFSNNIRSNFGYLCHLDPSFHDFSSLLFQQQGRKVFKEVIPFASKHILEHLALENISPAALKRLWLHQANSNINRLVAERVFGREASLTEAPIILDQYGNTSSAGCWIAYDHHHDDFAIDDIGVICAFGAGYSVGSVVVKKIK